MNGKLIIETSEYQTVEYDLKNCFPFEGIPLSSNGESVSNGLRLIAQFASKEFKTDEKKKQEIEKQNKIKELREEHEKVRRIFIDTKYLSDPYLEARSSLYNIEERLVTLEGCYRITEDEWNQIKESVWTDLYLGTNSPFDGISHDITNSVFFAFRRCCYLLGQNHRWNKEISCKKTDKPGVVLVSATKILDLETLKRCAEMVRPVTYTFEYEHIAE